MLSIPQLSKSALPSIREQAQAALQAIPSVQRRRFRAHIQAALRHGLTTPTEVLEALRAQPHPTLTPRSLLIRASARWQARPSGTPCLDLRSVAPLTLETTTDARAEQHRRTLLRAALRRGLISPATLLDGLAGAGPHTTPVPRLLQDAFTTIAHGARAAANTLAHDLGLPSCPPLSLPCWSLERPLATGPALLAWPEPNELLKISSRLSPRLLAGLACEPARHPLGTLFDSLSAAHHAVLYMSPARVVDHFIDGYDYFSELLTDAVADCAFPTTRKSRTTAIARCVEHLIDMGEIAGREQADQILPDIERVLDLLNLRALYSGAPAQLTRAEEKQSARLRFTLEHWLAALERGPSASEELCRTVYYAETRFLEDPPYTADDLQEPWLALLPRSNALIDTVSQHLDDLMNAGTALGFFAIHRDGEPLLAAVERLTYELALWNVLSYALAEAPQ